MPIVICTFFAYYIILNIGLEKYQKAEQDDIVNYNTELQTEEQSADIYSNELDKIMQGDFSVIQNLDEDAAEELERIYLNRQENTVWLYHDINHDGIDELIYQEKEIFQENMHPILGIFAITDNGCERILWDTGDYTKFFFLIGSRIIYHYQYSGIYQYSAFELWDFDTDWTEKRNRTYEIFNIIDLTEFNNIPEDSFNVEKIDVQKEGYYYRIIDWDNMETEVSESKWMEGFENDIGNFETFIPLW